MPDLVVDASIALAWGLPDESSTYAVAVLAAVEHDVMHVPDLWAYEVANGLVIATRRQRITQAMCKHSCLRCHAYTCGSTAAIH